jgi:hippurate hydrolase
VSTTSRARALLASDLDWQDEFYRDLHRNPELSHQEHRTAGKAAEKLRSSGYEVREGIGGTGLVGVLRNGDGPTVLLRADMDALPVLEETGLDHASTATGTDPSGATVPVMHACGHDVHVTCLLGAAEHLATGTQHWSGTVVALFQPAEEIGDGARGMVADGLADHIPKPDVVLGQHVLPSKAGTVATHAGPTLSAADSFTITVHGRGGHGSMPHTTTDPVVLAAMIVVRLQTVVAREVPPGDTAVLTVGSIRAGTKSNIIPDSAVIEVNLRSYDEQTRQTMIDAVRRVVRAECEASACPAEPEFEHTNRFPLTDNDTEVTERVAESFSEFFGSRAGSMQPWPASEDFGEIADAFGAPYTYWGLGGTDPALLDEAHNAGPPGRDVPGNHSPRFAPIPQPTLTTGTQALVVAALTWL